MPAAAASALYAARMFMRPVWTALGAKPFVLGGPPLSFQLRQLGYLDMLIAHLSGTFTVANAGLVFGAMGPYQAVSNFLLQSPSQQPALNIGGANLHVWNLRASDFAPYRRQFRYPAQGVLDANAYHASIVDQVPVAVGAQTMHLWWVLPFHVNCDDPRGNIALGNSGVTNLIVTPDSLADLVTVAANLTLQNLSLDVVQVYYTPPPMGAPTIPGSQGDAFSVTYDETYQAVPATGLNKVEIVPSFTILGILHALTLNGALDSADVSSAYLRVNQSYFTDPAGITGAVQTIRQFFEGGVPLPVGFFLYDQDLQGAQGWIHTEAVTELESALTIAAGANITNGKIYTSIRRLVPVG